MKDKIEFEIVNEVPGRYRRRYKKTSAYKTTLEEFIASSNAAIRVPTEDRKAANTVYYGFYRAIRDNGYNVRIYRRKNDIYVSKMEAAS